MFIKLLRTCTIKDASHIFENNLKKPKISKPQLFLLFLGGGGAFFSWLKKSFFISISVCVQIFYFDFSDVCFVRWLICDIRKKRYVLLFLNKRKIKSSLISHSILYFLLWMYEIISQKHYFFSVITVHVY